MFTLSRLNAIGKPNREIKFQNFWSVPEAEKVPFSGRVGGWDNHLRYIEIETF